MSKHSPIEELTRLLLAYAELQCKHHHHKEHTLKGTFQISLTVDQPQEPLAVVASEDLGPAGGPLAVPSLEISGGTPPYNVAFNPSSGQMPDGMSLNPDGSFAGVPNTPGTYNITVDVTDSLG